MCHHVSFESRLNHAVRYEISSVTEKRGSEYGVYPRAIPLAIPHHKMGSNFNFRERTFYRVW